MDPDAHAKEFEGTEENPKDIQEIKEEIIHVLAKEEETNKLLPESVKVSIFHIDLKQISKSLSGKFAKLAKNLKESISNRAKK